MDTIRNQKICAGDIFGLGDLCSRIRRRAGIRPKEIENEVKYSSPAIGRFERGEIFPEEDNFQKYVQALQLKKLKSNKQVDRPLTADEIQILLDLFTNYSHKEKIEKLESDLAAITFSQELFDQRQPVLHSLLEALEQQDKPAYIMDALWFNHAMNGALLDLFGINLNSTDPQDNLTKFFHEWYAWHVMGVKFCDPQSPFRRRHTNTNVYFPPVVDQFFKDIYPYLFTFQMRQLLCRLRKLSDHYGFKFSSWWYSATCFDLPFDQEALNRDILHSSQQVPIRVYSNHHTKKYVDLDENISVPFSLVVWEPQGSEAEEVFDHIKRSKNCHTIYYAAPYSRGSLHVNDWPEVKAYLERSV